MVDIENLICREVITHKKFDDETDNCNPLEVIRKVLREITVTKTDNDNPRVFESIFV